MKNKNIIFTLSAQVGIQLIGLTTGVIVARFLGPEGRGELAAIVSWVSMIVTLGNMGIPVAYVYAVARDPLRVRQLLGNGMFAILIQWPLIVCVGFVILTYALNSQTTDVLRLSILYLFFYIPLNLLTLYSNAILQGLQKFKEFNVVRISVSGSYLVLLLILAFFYEVSVHLILYITLLSNFVTLGIALFYVFQHIDFKLKNKKCFDLKKLKHDFIFGLKAHIGTMQPFSNMQIDLLLLTTLLLANDLGLYMASLAGAGIIKAQGVALGMVVMPEVAKEKCINFQIRTISRYAKLAFFCGVSTATIAIVWAEKLIILVYGKEFINATIALKYLVVGAVAASVYRVIADGLRGIGKPLVGTRAEILSFVVGIPAIYFLTSLYGVEGAAVSSVIASSVALLAALFSLLNLKKNNSKFTNLKT